MKPHSQAFTLVELLVVAAFGAVIAGTTASILIGQFREGLLFERVQRARGDMNRLALFLETEVSEGSEIVPGQALSGCSNTGNSVITVNLPFWDASTRAFVTSQYYVDSSGNLRRCGPPILANGQLNHAGTRIDSILSSNANLVHGNATTDPAGSVAYTITLSDGQGNTLLSRTSRARAHGDLIDD